jgi:cadmium resistance protein CadD (predicted permease)
MYMGQYQDPNPTYPVVSIIDNINTCGSTEVSPVGLKICICVCVCVCVYQTNGSVVAYWTSWRASLPNLRRLTLNDGFKLSSLAVKSDNSDDAATADAYDGVVIRSSRYTLVEFSPTNMHAHRSTHSLVRRLRGKSIIPPSSQPQPEIAPEDLVMQNGNALLTALSTFAITNIDDLFVLVTFFAESHSHQPSLTPTAIVVGQYVGFTTVLAISMVGFELLVGLPTEVIGFLGLLPILLGLWGLIGMCVQEGRGGIDDDEGGMEAGVHVGVGVGGWKAISKVALITLVNSGDNIGTYIPLFAQASTSDLAVYAVTCYVLLGAWCFVAWLVMQQKVVLSLAEKCAGWIVPGLYLGLGVWIIMRSGCYPWLGNWVDAETDLNGFVVLAEATVGIMGLCIGGMVWIRVRERRGGKGVYSRVARAEHDVDMNV